MSPEYLMIICAVVVACVRHQIKKAAVRKAVLSAGGDAATTAHDSTFTSHRAEEITLQPGDHSPAVHCVTPGMLEHGAWETYCNREDLLSSYICACFICMTYFFPEEIKVWRDGRTAICPHCGKPAVLPDTSHLPLTEGFLRKMKERYGKMVA